MDNDLVVLARLGTDTPQSTITLHFTPTPDSISPNPISSTPWGDGVACVYELNHQSVKATWSRQSDSGIFYYSSPWKGSWLTNVASIRATQSSFVHPLWYRPSDPHEWTTRVLLHVEGGGQILGEQSSSMDRFDPTIVCPLGSEFQVGGNSSSFFLSFRPAPYGGWRYSHWEYDQSPALVPSLGQNDVGWFTNPEYGPSYISATAHFVPLPTNTARVTVEREGEGTVTPGVGTHDYATGDSLVLDAEPQTGWIFSHWETGTGVAFSSHPRTLFTAHGDTTVRAVFKKNPILLTHVIGEGYVLRDPEGVFYPQLAGTPPQDAVVRLEAVPNADAAFVQWEGTGVAYATSALTNPLALDNPSAPLNLSVIWVVMGPDLPGGTRSITARFRCSCGCGAYVDPYGDARCETLCGEACVDVDLCPDDPDKKAPGACGCDVPDTDSDGDWVPDCNDECPDEPGKAEEGACGCYEYDIDNDGDGTPNCQDECPFDTYKTERGVCDCYTPDIDSDGDGTMDCEDACPDNPLLIEEGPCGCDTTDTDGDGTLDCQDECPTNPLLIVEGPCGCDTTDTDGDGTLDCQDGCPENPYRTEPSAFGCAMNVLIQADLVDLVPEGGNYASGIDEETLELSVNGTLREPEILCTQDGIHIEFLLPIQELLEPGENIIHIFVKDNAGNFAISFDDIF